jgi:hypothetical protein
VSAVISSCGKFRYRLDRTIGMFGATAAIVMVNPSTADAAVDDATIRRIIGFGKRLNWSRIIVGNVFAYRATDVRSLASARDPVGPENTKYLRQIFSEAHIAVVAWGPLAKLPIGLRAEWQSIPRLADEADASLMCWGVARDGHPRHPLMLSYGAELVDWAPPAGLDA